VHATVALSRAIHGDSPTTPSCEAKSARSNTFFAAYSKTAVAKPGLNTSTASHARENLPGFLPSCKNPKHGSNPLAAITRVIRATAIPTAKLWSACNGVSANLAVNCRGSSPVFPCARPMYLVWKLPHCSGGLNPLLHLEISPSGEESLVNKKVAAFEQSRVRWNEIASDQLDNVAGNQLVDRN
jgi:hypothetical protein